MLEAPGSRIGLTRKRSLHPHHNRGYADGEHGTLSARLHGGAGTGTSASEAWIVIAPLTVMHERRVDDGDTKWGQDAVTVDHRTFRLNLGAGDRELWKVPISQVLGWRPPREREPQRAVTTASSSQ